MNKDTLLKSRLKTLNKVIFVILALILVKIVYMTTIEGDQYVDLANQKTYNPGVRLRIGTVSYLLGTLQSLPCRL